MKGLAFSTLIIFTSVALFAFLLNGCGGEQAEWAGKIKHAIKVKNEPVPHGKVLVHFEVIIGDRNLISDMSNTVIGIMEGVIADEELKKLKFVFVDFTGPGYDNYGKDKTVDIATLKIPVEEWSKYAKKKRTDEFAMLLPILSFRNWMRPEIVRAWRIRAE